ncbi:MAG: two-component regulator propeller domain-containing protein, partial [Chitinophagales bacterium]
FFIDYTNECWLGTVDNGLYRFKLNDDYTIQPIAHYVNDANDQKSLSDNSVWSFYQDASDILWIGTRKALSKFIRATDEFNYYPLVTPQFNLTRVIIGSMSADENGTLWMISESDTVYAYLPSKRELKKFPMSKASGSEINGLLVLLASKTGDLFIGTAGSGLFEIPREEKEKFLSSARYIPKAISPPASKIENMTSIQSLAEDQSGNIWAGSGKGLFVYHTQTGTAEPIIKTNKQSGLDASNIIRCVTCAPDGNIWIGTDNGLFSYLPSSGKLTSYFHVADDSASLPDNGITCIHAEKNNRIWLGTKKGLCSYDFSSMKFQNFKIAYAGNFLLINAIEDDSKGNLWVSTNEGLLRIVPASSTEIKFNIHDGLITNRFNANASCSSDGLLLFGNDKGFVSFFPDSIKSNARIPKVKFTDFKLNNESIFTQHSSALLTDFLQQQKLTLRYNQNFFTISFVALDFADPFSNQYEYKLVGVDKEWVHAGNQSFASYTNVQPGSYRFAVTAANNHGVKNPKSTSLQIIIAPPWYRTWWFYTLVVLAFLSALYLFYRYRINQIKKLFSIRSKIARDLHDDVGSTLSSISLMSQMAKDFSDQQSSEKELFETISYASKEAMELMSDIVWSVNPKNDKVSNILVRMREYASSMLEAAGIEFRIELSDEAKDLVIPMEKRKDFYLIYKEAINNMAKYSRAENANVSLRKAHGKLILLIEDNGKGFNVEENRSGNGVVNMQQRANFIGAILHIDSKPGKGTKIELELPLVSV